MSSDIPADPIYTKIKTAEITGQNYTPHIITKITSRDRHPKWLPSSSAPGCHIYIRYEILTAEIVCLPPPICPSRWIHSALCRKPKSPYHLNFMMIYKVISRPDTTGERLIFSRIVSCGPPVPDMSSRFVASMRSVSCFGLSYYVHRCPRWVEDTSICGRCKRWKLRW
jgi:hypothetical protein